jgi:hypothetical protein
LYLSNFFSFQAFFKPSNRLRESAAAAHVNLFPFQISKKNDFFEEIIDEIGYP